MDIISARKSVGRITGRVLVNGVPRRTDFTRKTAYVPPVGARAAGAGHPEAQPGRLGPAGLLCLKRVPDNAGVASACSGDGINYPRSCLPPI